MHDIREVKAARKRIGLTQSELAKLSGVSQSLIAKIESGDLDPSYSNAMRIFETLSSVERQKDVLCSEIMNSRIISVTPSDNVADAIQKMRKHEISQLPVMRGNDVVGYVSESTLLDSVLAGSHRSQKVEDIMDDAPPTVPSRTSRTIAGNLLRSFPLIIITEKGKPVGIITKADLLKTIYKR